MTEGFAEYLLRHIRQGGLGTQSELARRTEINVSYINKIAKGRIMRPEAAPSPAWNPPIRTRSRAN